MLEADELFHLHWLWSLEASVCFVSFVGLGSFGGDLLIIALRIRTPARQACL